LAVFYSDGDENKIQQAKERFLNTFSIVPRKVYPPRLFYSRVSRDGVEEYK
jgi:hypothetical protein